MRHQKVNKHPFLLEWEAGKNDHGLFKFVFKLKKLKNPYADRISVNVIQELNHVVFTFSVNCNNLTEFTFQKNISKAGIAMQKNMVYQDFYAGWDNVNNTYSFIMIEKRINYRSFDSECYFVSMLVQFQYDLLYHYSGSFC